MPSRCGLIIKWRPLYLWRRYDISLHSTNMSLWKIYSVYNIYFCSYFCPSSYRSTVSLIGNKNCFCDEGVAFRPLILFIVWTILEWLWHSNGKTIKLESDVMSKEDTFGWERGSTRKIGTKFKHDTLWSCFGRMMRRDREWMWYGGAVVMGG